MTMRLRYALCLAFVVGGIAKPAPAIEIGLDPRATYLRTDPADIASGALSASPIDLGALGITPGDLVLLEVLGDYSPSIFIPLPDDSTSVVGVFSSSHLLLDPSILDRVPGAIEAGVDVVTGITYFLHQTTDITQDFRLNPSVTLTVPSFAAYLFVATDDIAWNDNYDPDGDFGLRITSLSGGAVPEPSTLGLLGMGGFFLVARLRCRCLSTR